MDELVIQWIQHIKMIWYIYKRMDVEWLLTLRLWDGTIVVYQQLDQEEKASLQHIKGALIAAYTPDSFDAYNQFAMNGDLADLQWLDLHVGDQHMSWAFMLGLPHHVRWLFQVSSKMDAMPLEQLVTQAQSIMTMEPEEIAAATQQTHACQLKHESVKLSAINISVTITWPGIIFRNMQKKLLINHANCAKNAMFSLWYGRACCISVREAPQKLSASTFSPRKWRTRHCQQLISFWMEESAQTWWTLVVCRG